MRARRGRLPLWPILGLALLGAGCAGPDVPYPESHAASGQKTLRAVHHWDVLADDIAARMVEKTRDWPAGAHPIYVTAKADTRFNQGFRKLLMNRLADRGVAVTTEPSTVQLVFEAQVVQHLQPASGALEWTPLASGVSVARDGVHFHGANSLRPAEGGDGKDVDASKMAAGKTGSEGDVVIASGSAFGAAVAATQIRKAPVAPEVPVTYPRLGTPSRSEVLVTTALESGGRYLAGTSDVYSIVHDDALLYLPAEPRFPGPAPASIKTWRVVSP